MLQGGFALESVADAVAHGHRVGGGAAPEAHLAAQHRGKGFPDGQRAQQKVASRVLDDRRDPFHHFARPTSFSAKRRSASVWMGRRPVPVTASIARRVKRTISSLASASTPSCR